MRLVPEPKNQNQGLKPSLDESELILVMTIKGDLADFLASDSTIIGRGYQL